MNRRENVSCITRETPLVEYTEKKFRARFKVRDSFEEVEVMWISEVSESRIRRLEVHPPMFGSSV